MLVLGLLQFLWINVTTKSVFKGFTNFLISEQSTDRISTRVRRWRAQTERKSNLNKPLSQPKLSTAQTTTTTTACSHTVHGTPSNCTVSLAAGTIPLTPSASPTPLWRSQRLEHQPSDRLLVEPWPQFGSPRSAFSKPRDWRQCPATPHVRHDDEVHGHEAGSGPQNCKHCQHDSGQEASANSKVKWDSPLLTCPHSTQRNENCVA